MQVTGVGSSFSYYYDMDTQKLVSKGNEEDAFVKWYNGEITDEQLPEEFNGFDQCKKTDLKKLFEFMNMSRQLTGINHLQAINDENQCEVSVNIVDADTTEFSVNGKHVLTANKAVRYTEQEIRTFSTIQQPYKTKEGSPYNAEDNSISIGVGDVFDVGNGYTLTVKEDHIYAEGFGNGSLQDDEKANSLVWGLNALIHFADQQWFAGMIDGYEDSTQNVLELLKKLGVDTSREFKVNETVCEVVGGRIREVGNTHVVPGSIYEQALKRYEEQLYLPISEFR